MYLSDAKPTIEHRSIPSGRRGTAATLRIMRALADAGSRDLFVRETAARVVGNLRGHDFTGEVRAVHQYVRDRIRFLRDIAGTELLQGPRYTIQRGYGDCDDKATLVVAMLKSIGHPSELRFRAIGTGGAGFSHVYPVVKLAGRWVAMDTTHAGTPLGWQYPYPSMVGDLRA